MNMAPVDWLILFGTLAFLVSGVVLSRTYMRSVADFLAANRTAGRYLLTVSQGVAAFGAITVVGLLEMNYVAGFAMTWWGFTMGVVILVLTVTGWVVYRFRQTRVLTLAQFFEVRYGRRFRVFTGLIAFLAGIVNMGIFPSVGARFFIYFCGLPETVEVLGLTLDTYPLTMIVLLSIALFFVFVSGQIAVIVTDFIQGLFVNVVFVVITLFLLTQVDWTQIFEALATAPEEQSKINPFKTSHVADFNFWYFLIGVFGVIYNTMSWQGTQAYNASARNAHEAKMGGVLTNWRGFPQNLLILMVPIIAYTVMNHADFAGIATQVSTTLGAIGNEEIRNQLRIPLILATMLPVGLMGAFAAVMLAAFISTHDTYLHSWGSIFIQDVVMPFRRKPFEPKQHILVLRLAILGVAVFIFLWSWLVPPAEYIFMFFAVTGAIFAGGSGAVLIGGLYWSRGTAAAAWVAMITGSTIATAGVVIHHFTDDFPINGQMFWAIAMGASSLLYVLVSLLGKREVHNLDKILHRGRYAIPDETRVQNEIPSRGWRMLAVTREFSRGDKLLYLATYAWTLTWTVIFIVGTVYNLTHDVDDSAWIRFWEIYIYIQIVLAVIVVVWFAIGGTRDIRSMIGRLRVAKRDATDDGWVPVDDPDGERRDA